MGLNRIQRRVLFNQWKCDQLSTSQILSKMTIEEFEELYLDYYEDELEDGIIIDKTYPKLYEHDGDTCPDQKVDDKSGTSFNVLGEWNKKLIVGAAVAGITGVAVIAYSSSNPKQRKPQSKRKMNKTK